MMRSLLSSLEHLHINLAHNDNIMTFHNVARHVEFEEDRLLAGKLSIHV